MLFDVHELMVDVMGKKKVLGIAVILGLTLLNVWMARYVVKPMNERRLYRQAILAGSRAKKADILVISVEDIHPIDHLKEARQEDEDKALGKKDQRKGVAPAHDINQGPNGKMQKGANVETGMWNIDSSLMNLDTASLARIKLKLQNIKDALQARKIQNGALEMKTGYLGGQGQARSSGAQMKLLHKREQIEQNDPGIAHVGGALSKLHSLENAADLKVTSFNTNKPTALRSFIKSSTAARPLTRVNTQTHSGLLQKTEISVNEHPQNLRPTGPDPHLSATPTIQGRVIDPNPLAVTLTRNNRKQTAAPFIGRDQASLGRFAEPAISIPENIDSGSPALLPGDHILAEDTAVSNKGKPRQYDFIRRMNEQMIENIARENQVEVNTAERAMLESILRDMQAGQMQVDKENVPLQ